MQPTNAPEPDDMPIREVDQGLVPGWQRVRHPDGSLSTVYSSGYNEPLPPDHVRAYEQRQAARIALRRLALPPELRAEFDELRARIGIVL